MNDKWMPIKENCSHFPNSSKLPNVNSFDRHDSVWENASIQREGMESVNGETL